MVDEPDVLYRVCPTAVMPGKLRQLTHDRVGQRAHAAHRVRGARGIDGDDADRFLSAMLQRIQAELREVGRVRVAVNAEDTAHKSLGLRFERELLHCNREGTRDS